MENVQIIDEWDSQTSLPTIRCSRDLWATSRYAVLDEARRLNGGHIGKQVLFFPDDEARLMFVLKFQGLTE